MKHLKKMATGLLLEKVAAYQQLSLFDDTISSQTIAMKLLAGYRSPTIIDKTATITTVDDASRYINSPEVIQAAAVEAYEASDTSSESLDYIRIDIDVMAKHMPKDPESLYKVLAKMVEERDLTDSAEYNNLIVDDELVDFETFKKELFYVTLPDLCKQIADDLNYVDKHSVGSLNDLFDSSVIETMAKEQVRETPRTLDHEYLRQLQDAIYSADDEDTIEIYRALVLPYSHSKLDASMSGNKGVGIYWSYCDEGAVAHGACSSNGFTITLKAKVNVRNVNWEATMYKALYDLKEEQEIELKEGVTVQIIGYELSCADTDRFVTSWQQYYTKGVELNTRTLRALTQNLHQLRNTTLSKPITVRV